MSETENKASKFEAASSHDRTSTDGISPQMPSAGTPANITSDIVCSVAREMGLASEHTDQADAGQADPRNTGCTTPAQLRRALWVMPKQPARPPVTMEIVREAAEKTRLSGLPELSHFTCLSTSRSQRSAVKYQMEARDDRRENNADAASAAKHQANDTCPASPVNRSDAQRHHSLRKIEQAERRDEHADAACAHFAASGAKAPLAPSPPVSVADSEKKRNEPPDVETPTHVPPAGVRIHPAPLASTGKSDIPSAHSNTPEHPIVSKASMSEAGDEDWKREHQPVKRLHRSPAVALRWLSFCLLVAFALADILMPPGRHTLLLLLKSLLFTAGIMSAMLSMFFRPRRSRVFALALLFLFVFQASNRKPLLWLLQRAGIVQSTEYRYDRAPTVPAPAQHRERSPAEGGQISADQG